MGRTSKFLFPLPGRRSTKKKEKERIEIEPPKSSVGLSINNHNNHQSKAQRILGMVHGLNIDSPTRSDAPSWNYPSSRSSGMSISISESTQSTKSTAETESISDRWEQESGVLGTRRALEKASSTVLGQQYGDDGFTDTSSISRRMRHEASNSTLKSYYDRQKSPLSVSQQTSASSARDLALRKGYPPIARSPLLNVDAIDPFDQGFVGNNGDLSRNASSKKKPARLDLSILFPRSSRKSAAAESLMSPASIISNTTNGSASRYSQSQSGRKLTKRPSKESLQSQKHSIRSTQSERQHSSRDNYDHQPVRPSPMGRIPESRVPDMETQSMKVDSRRNRPASRSASLHPNSASDSQRHDRPRASTSNSNPPESQAFSWRSVRSSMATGNPQWDQVSSGASISSRNTKNSRHTSNSVFSSSDLKQSSVLSLSSDSEDGLSDDEPVRSPAPPSLHDKASRVINGSSRASTDNHAPAAPKPQQQPPFRKPSRKGAAVGNAFQPIPETSLPDPRISGPWSPPNISTPLPPEKLERRPSKQKPEKKPISLSAKRALQQQQIPVLNSTALEVREANARDSRYMAVTKQEEQLLSALRQKRANMREKIISEHEHEITKVPTRSLTPSPPHIPLPHIPTRKSSRYLEALSHSSSISTIRGPDGSSNKEHIPLYLDAPAEDIDHPEPSPDLSDFLSFGSDGDSTPRTSYAPPQSHNQLQHPQKRDRSASAIRRGDKISPMTPPSAARLSAVGAGDFLQPIAHIRHGHEASTKKRGAGVGVRFVEDEKMVVEEGERDFLMDESEGEGVWGM